MPMKRQLLWSFCTQRQQITRLCMALLLACCVLLIFPGTSFAHAVLIRSDPAQGAVLHVPPGQVSLWFSEAVDPQLSTAQVVTTADQQAGPQQAKVSQSDSSEIVVTLSSHLTPGVYAVLWRTVSTDDGHVESGSFSFTVTRPDGTLPPNTQSPGKTTTTNASSIASFLNASTLVSFLMVTLVELGAIGWVGAMLFQIFVLEPALEEHPAQRSLHQQVRASLLDRVQPGALGLLLLAHLGVLLGQILALTQGKSAAAFTPAIFQQLVLSGRFGLWWLVRLFLLLMMFLLLLSGRQVRQRTDSFNRFLSWVSLGFGLLLLIALAMSSHAAALPSDKVLVAVLIDWLHLVAAALWVGGMLTIVLSYVPMLVRRPLAEQAASLVTILPYYSPWALLGVLLMAVTGPFSASFQLASWQQLFSTAYGNVLLVKVFLVMSMLVLSAYQILVVRPRLPVALHKHSLAVMRQEAVQSQTEPDGGASRLAGQVKQREIRLAQSTRRLLTVLRLEPLLGVAVLLCVGLMNALGGTLVPATTTPSTSSAPHVTAQPTQEGPLALSTFDHQFQVLLTMTPRHVGTNSFQVRVADPHTGKALTTVNVQLEIELPDQTMGNVVVPLKGDGTGQFRGSTDLAVSGTWRIVVQIQTPDDPYHFHEAYTDIALTAP
jgi:copper transport protein